MDSSGRGGGAGGCDGVVVRCSAGQTRRGSTAGGVHRHSREGFGTGSSWLRRPRWHGPSQASNQVNVLVAGLHGRRPCLSAVSPAQPGEHTDM